MTRENDVEKVSILYRRGGGAVAFMTASFFLFACRPRWPDA